MMDTSGTHSVKMRDSVTSNGCVSGRPRRFVRQLRTRVAPRLYCVNRCTGTQDTRGAETAQSVTASPGIVKVIRGKDRGTPGPRELAERVRLLGHQPERDTQPTPRGSGVRSRRST